ncbi:MAG: histidinol-phosphate transaminase [Gammaproteobacteria bacterium]
MALKDRIKQLVRPEIQAMNAYHVPPATGMIKLDAMENPWPWPDELRAAWLEALHGLELNRYPDPSARALQDALRTAMAVPATAGVMPGNGSDELIQMIIQTVAGPGRVIMAPEPTFVMYRQIATVAGLEFVGVPLDAQFALDRQSVLDTVVQTQPAVIFLAYPNNPTGNLFDAAVIREILEHSSGLVVVDEAYAPFADASFMPELERYDNLLVLRTVSKLGLAGLRLGLLAGHPEWITQIDKTRLPYNIGTLNQVTGVLALAHRDVFDAQARHIRTARAALDAGLRRFGQLVVYPSEANFILFRVPAGRAAEVFDALKQAGILIKNLDGTLPALRDCLRVTVGQPQENAAFLAALAELF